MDGRSNKRNERKLIMWKSIEINKIFGFLYVLINKIKGNEVYIINEKDI